MTLTSFWEVGAMPQRPIDDYWKERVKSLLGADPRKEPGPRAIKRRLDAEAERMGRSEVAQVGYPPSERSITRIRDQEWQRLTDAERREYRELHWPDTFQRGDLPWEAGGAVLALLAWADMYGLPRPPVALARWYWQVTQSMPDSTVGMRLRIAVTVGTHLEAGRPLPEGLEWWLAYQSLPRESRQAYEQAVSRERDPLPRWERRMRVAVSGPSAAWAAGFILNQAAKAAIYEGEE
jgi:hypothetical protein